MTCHDRAPAGSVRQTSRRRAIQAGWAGALLLAAAAQGATAQSGDANAGDAEWGAYLASECVVCHQPSGDTPGIPNIASLSANAILEALTAYKLHLRPHPGMQLIAANLSADEIAALAAYFATLPPDGGANEGPKP